MKTLYLDCSSGAAGDMLAAALLELHPSPEKALDQLNSLEIPGVQIHRQYTERCGIRGSLFCVEVNGQEEHSDDVASHRYSHEHSYGENHDHNHGDGYDHSYEGHDPAHGENHAHSHSHGSTTDHSHENHEHDETHGHSHELTLGCESAPDVATILTHADSVEKVHVHTQEATSHTHEHTHKHSHAHTHEHHSLADVETIIRGLGLPDAVKQDACAVYTMLAEAEAKVHGRPVGEVHFHEVGAMDAIADITAVCLLVHDLAPDQIMVSPIRTGRGQVRCAHGILPVPAPATALLLNGMPVFSGDVNGEMCTPTGAALLHYFADSFGEMPLMQVKAWGYGMGKKEFPHMNGLRAMLGEMPDDDREKKESDGIEKSRAGSAVVVRDSGASVQEDPAVNECRAEEIMELSCNLDDMTGEQIGFAMEQLFAAGAKDVFTQAIGMKKNRPGILLTVICDSKDREKLVHAMFCHTTTLGIRETGCRRYVLNRSMEQVETEFGPLRYKLSEGYGIRRSKPEYEDLARMAREQDCSIEEIRKKIRE